MQKSQIVSSFILTFLPPTNIYLAFDFYIYRYFKKFGELGDIYIPRDRHTHESRGFAFVRFYEERDAEDAMDAMDGKVS